MVHLKEYFIDEGIAFEDSFPEYNALKITPLHIHKSKAEHKNAVFILAKELVALVSEEKPTKEAKCPK